LALGAALGLGIDLAALQLRAGALYLLPRTTDVPQAPGASMSLQLTAAELGACYALTRAPRLSPCAYAEIGSLRAQGAGLAHDEHSASLWLLGGLSVQLRLHLGPRLDLDTEASLGIPVRRAQIATRDAGEVYRVPVATGQVRAGLSLHFP
jgi:hypothetical protein